MNAVLTILIGSIFVNNFAMSRFYGICPFLGVSKKLETAFGMGMAVTFVMAVASLVAYLVNTFLLIPLEIEYLQTIAFILVIAVLVQIVEMAIKKMSPGLYQALGVYLPLITTNCAVLGVAQLNVTEGYNLILSVVNGVASAPGASGAEQHAQVDGGFHRRDDYRWPDGRCVQRLQRPDLIAERGRKPTWM